LRTPRGAEAFRLLALTYRDLGDGRRAVEVAGRRQRFSCRGCGSTTSLDPVELLTPFRMTPRLAEAVFSRSLAVGYLRAAEGFGIDERTVRSVFTRLSDKVLAEADAAMPRTILARVAHAGRHRIAFAHDTDGDLANLYADPFDPRLAATLSAMRRGRLHVDHRMAGIARRLLHPSCDITIHRASAEEALARLLPACLRRLHNHLPPEERRSLAPVRDILAKSPAAVSWSDSVALRKAAASSPPIAEFAERRDALIGIWGSPRLRAAVEGERAWRRGLSTLMRRAFAPVLSWLDEWSPLVLNRGYGKIPLQAWRRACAVVPPVLAHDSAARIVVRGLRHAPEPRARAPRWEPAFPGPTGS
jgi:hypothetical protein